MRDVYVIGAYTTQFKKHPDKSFHDLAREAYMGCLADAGMKDGRDIETGWLGNCGMPFWGQNSIRGQALFQPLVEEGLFPERVPMFNVENACATASTAFQGAWKDILAGTNELTLAVGVEKLFSPDDAARTTSTFGQGYITTQHERLVEEMTRVAELTGNKFETGPDRTIFMDTYAMQAKWHMWKYGTTQEQIASGAAKNHNYGALNEKAQYRFQMTTEAVLQDRPVSYPLTRAMCAPIGDGAAAALLCSAAGLANLPPAARARAVKVRTSQLSGGKYRALHEPGLSRVAADKAYAHSGMSPADVDLVELHDATSFCEIYQLEMLRLCPDGQGGRFVESGATALGGNLPVNVSGGLVSKGHPVGATGLSMVHEVALQLRGEAGARQVADARIGLIENGGGVMGFDEAACAVHILEKSD